MGDNRQFPRIGINISAAGAMGSSSVVTFSNANSISFGIDTASTMTASVAAGLSVAIQSISAGTTRVTSGEAVFSNSNAISFGANGQTITAALPKISFWNNSAGPAISQSWTGDSGGSNLHLQRVTFGLPIDATRADIIALGATTWSIGIYTMSGSTASLASSGSATASDAGGTTFVWKSMALGTWSITPGDYLVGMIASGGATAKVMGVFFGDGFNSTNFLGVPGGGSYSSYFAEGLYSTGVASLPASIHVSDIINSVNISTWYLQLAGTS
jgi:hypothetical protein